jgi:hypothetical protein
MFVGTSSSDAARGQRIASINSQRAVAHEPVWLPDAVDCHLESGIEAFAVGCSKTPQHRRGILRRGST